MMIMVLDGYPLDQVVLTGKVRGDKITKGWGRFYYHFSLKAGVGSSIFFWATVIRC